MEYQFKFSKSEAVNILFPFLFFLVEGYQILFPKNELVIRLH